MKINICWPCLGKRHYRPFSGPEYIDGIQVQRIFTEFVVCELCGKQTRPWTTDLVEPERILNVQTPNFYTGKREN